MNFMFYDCEVLTSLDLKNFDTSNVKRMQQTFWNCKSLTSLDLSSFNTSNVITMDGMFCGCSSLTSLDLSIFDTSEVKNMHLMFCNCSSLTTLDLSNFDTSNVTNFTGTFSSCNNLQLVNLSNASGKVSEVVSKIPVAATIYVPQGTDVGSRTENVVYCSEGGNTCDNLVINATDKNEILLSSPQTFTVEKITIKNLVPETTYLCYLPFEMDAKANGTFYFFTEYNKTTGNEKVVFNKLYNKEKTTANKPYLFKPKASQDIVIEDVSVSVNTTGETATEGLVGVYDQKNFTSCDANRRVFYYWTGSNFHCVAENDAVDVSRVYLKQDDRMAPDELPVVADDRIAYVVLKNNNSINFQYIEDELEKGGEITDFWYGEDLLNTSAETVPWSGNENVTSLVIDEGFQNVKPKNCSYWFANLTNLEEITGLKNLNTSKTTNMKGMFEGCSSLKSIDLQNFTYDNTFYVTDMSNMFKGCSSLTGLDIKFPAQNVTDMQGMFEGCSSITKLDLGSFYHSSVTNLSNVFKGCSALKSLKWRCSKALNVESVKSMYEGCSSLTTLDVPFSLSPTTLKDMSNMFKGCSNLTSITFSSSQFSITKEGNMEGMFDGCDNLRLLDISKMEYFISDFSFPEMEKYIINRPLTFLPTGVAVTAGRENVVVGNQCEHFVIDYEDANADQLLLSVPHTFTANKITINRNFTENNPHTLYLPFEMSVTDYGTFYTYKDYSGDKVTFSEIEGENTEVNMPYLFVPNKDGVIEITTPTEVSTTPTESTESEIGLVGVYEKKTFTESEANAKIYYGWAEGEFKRAGEGAKVDACRAYLKLPASSLAPARLSVSFDDDGTTGIGTIDNADSDITPAYNLQGQRVYRNYRGLVIKNGKKIINR